MFGEGTFQVTTLGGTFATAATGAAMLLAAPWVTRAVTAADAGLVRGLPGPGRLARRVHELEHTDEGLRAALEIRRRHPGTGVLVLPPGSAVNRRVLAVLRHLST